MENFSIKIYASSFVLQNDICSGGYFFQQNSELRRNKIYASSCVLPNDIWSGGYFFQHFFLTEIEGM